MMMWNIFYPIQSTLVTAYDLPFYIINFGTSTIQNITAIPGIFLSNYIFDFKGIGPGLVCGTLLTLTGLWVRIFADVSFTYFVIGQILGGLA